MPVLCAKEQTDEILSLCHNSGRTWRLKSQRFTSWVCSLLRLNFVLSRTSFRVQQVCIACSVCKYLSHVNGFRGRSKRLRVKYRVHIINGRRLSIENRKSDGSFARASGTYLRGWLMGGSSPFLSRNIYEKLKNTVIFNFFRVLYRTFISPPPPRKKYSSYAPEEHDNNSWPTDDRTREFHTSTDFLNVYYDGRGSHRWLTTPRARYLGDAVGNRNTVLLCVLNYYHHNRRVHNTRSQ